MQADASTAAQFVTIRDAYQSGDRMKTVHLSKPLSALLLISSFLLAGPTFADKPQGAGKSGKSGKDQRDDRHDDRRDDQRAERKDDRGHSKDGKHKSSGRERSHFEERHRTLVRDYYGEQYRSGRCPPGLAKKNNGCMPPGQAKKWHMGQPLPRDVIYYTVPQSLVVQFGTPPSGYRYVRVASDILMIAIGTGMVVDAIQNLGG